MIRLGPLLGSGPPYAMRHQDLPQEHPPDSDLPQDLGVVEILAILPVRLLYLQFIKEQTTRAKQFHRLALVVMTHQVEVDIEGGGVGVSTVVTMEEAVTGEVRLVVREEVVRTGEQCHQIVQQPSHQENILLQSVDQH